MRLFSFATPFFRLRIAPEIATKVGSLGEVELSKLGADRGEAFGRAHIIVLVVAHQDFLGNALDRLGIKEKGLGS
jgi:hypothetical protein